MPAAKSKVIYPPAILVSIYSGASKILIPFLLLLMLLLFGWPFGTYAYFSNSGVWSVDPQAPIPEKPVDDEAREFRHMIYMIIVIAMLVLYLLGMVVVKSIWTMPSLIDQQSSSK